MTHKHRPDTPPPKPLPKLPLVEWVPLDFRSNAWGLTCPRCRTTEPRTFPRSAVEADAVRDHFADLHRACFPELGDAASQ